MSKIIITENDAGELSLIYPSDQFLSILKIEEIAKKDVPNGDPFWIIDSSEIPEDRTFFSAWELDKEKLGEPHGHGVDYQNRGNLL